MGGAKFAKSVDLWQGQVIHQTFFYPELEKVLGTKLVSRDKLNSNYCTPFS